MKTRASAHDAQIREFEITADGFVVGDHFAADQDLACEDSVAVRRLGAVRGVSER